MFVGCTCAVQVRGVRSCLETLGCWPAAAAAYLDLLAGKAEEDDGWDQDNAGGAGVRVPVEGEEEADEPDSGWVLVLLLCKIMCTVLCVALYLAGWSGACYTTHSMHIS